MPVPRGDFTPWLLLLIPTVGGILSGVIVFSLAPEAEGHGTDAVIKPPITTAREASPLPRPHC